MAERHSTRPKSGHARKPSQTRRRKPAPKSGSQAPTATAVLADVTLHLKVAMAATVVCCAALKAQNADSDEDAAVVLQRCVADELDRQIERLDAVIARRGS